MKFNPITQELFTDDNQLIKVLACPLNLEWEQLDVTDGISRKCFSCNQHIIDTQFLTDEALQEMILAHPHTCLKVDFNQNNINIITDGLLKEK